MVGPLRFGMPQLSARPIRRNKTPGLSFIAPEWLILDRCRSHPKKIDRKRGVDTHG
jgi:hypothetical protein